MKRYLENQVVKDLERKMVFVGGPRQVGKTTLARAILGESKGIYLNWDFAEHRSQILEGEFPKSPMLVLDELHKFTSWRSLLKGFYDLHGKDVRILVTGSARLDYYRFGGDSLQGRYHYLRLHPLSVGELGLGTQDDFESLFVLGGFPEPFLSGSEVEAKRWNNEYRQRLIDDDVRSLEGVRDLGNLEILAHRLPRLVGSPLSANAIREDLQVSHKAVSNWLEILERLYHIFRIYPFGAPNIKALKKEPKHYQWNWFQVRDDGPRFENLVASHLLKWVHFRYDTAGDEIELRYFRDRDGREIDFVVVNDGSPVLAIECKLSPGPVSPHLVYFKRKFPDCKATQLSFHPSDHVVGKEGIEKQHALTFLQELV